jgi:ABC-type branched-subunit amino acid transport system substrate-binding protein
VRTRTIRYAAALVAALLLLVACGGNGGAPADDGQAAPDDGAVEPPTGEPIKIGVIMPLSGPVAFIGTIQNAVFTAWAEYINEVEGGIHGRPIEVISEDDEADSARAIAAVRSLADQGVLAVFGPPISGIIDAAYPVAAELGINMVTIGATPSLIRENPEWLFQVGAMSGSDAEPMTNFARDLMGDGALRVALAPIDTASSFEWRDAIQSKWADEFDLEVTSSTTLPLAAADVTAEVQNMLQGDPDIILTQALDSVIPVMVERLRDLGFTGPVVIFHGGGSDSNLLRLQDPDVFVQREFAGFDTDDSDRPGLARYKEMIARAGLEQDARDFVQHQLGGLGAVITFGALRACGPDCNDPSDLNAALNSLSVDTEGLTYGPIELGPQDRQALVHSVFYHWQDGQIVPALDGAVYVGDAHTMQ